MNDLYAIDTIEQRVRQTALQHHFRAETQTQQILLLGDAFYGYRFIAADFAAVWSAADNTLNFFDANGQLLTVAPLEAGNNIQHSGTGTIPFPAFPAAEKCAA
ncbi:MAG: hypothetical protein LBT46_09835 [Planctomycetaceae bacterium]|jgi:hypothetical protein|nr:hypothetical protein [Planctomycetaceae bacterium]